MNDLEQLLSQPMADIEDDGFSAKVQAKAKRQTRKQQVLITLIKLVLVLGSLVLAWISVLLFKKLLPGIELASSSLNTSVQLPEAVITNSQFISMLHSPVILMAIVSAFIVSVVIKFVD